MSDAARQTHYLQGCAPTPLAHYLKALAVLRLVSEQKDATARGYWKQDTFVLETRLTREELLEFFLEEYRPTPAVTPWNGGGGFDLSGPAAPVVAIQNSTTTRLESYREVIDQTFNLMRRLGYQDKMSTAEKGEKDRFLSALRSNLSDTFLPWLDAAIVLTEGGTRFPPILGTGGNDGRLDFINNFMQRIADVIDLQTGNAQPLSRAWLQTALFDENHSELSKAAAIGQFFPQAAGGPNATSGFTSDSLTNPWDFIFMIEGSLSFAAASVKQLESAVSGAMSAPFSVRASAVGYGSAAASDEPGSRAELWVPLWERAASNAEISTLMSEGRVRLGKRPARDGVDFARAISALGVDRGLSAFQRYGLQERNGRAFFAVPLNRLTVSKRPEVNLLMEIDGWLNDFRYKAGSDKAPASLRRTLHNLEEAIFALCQSSGPRRVQAVLIALGECEKAMASSFKWTQEAFLRPIPPLSQRWLQAADDGSAELRLAASLASVYARLGTDALAFRAHLEPVSTRVKKNGGLRVNWQDNLSRDIVWHDGNLINSLNKIFSRRLIRAVQSGESSYPDQSRVQADLRDVSAFIHGQVDDSHLQRLIWAMILLDWPAVHGMPLARASGPRPLPGAAFALLKLCFPGSSKSTDTDDIKIPIVPAIHRQAASGDGPRATQQAARRLRASGLVPAVDVAPLRGVVVQRAAAALLFPLSQKSLASLREAVLRPESDSNADISESLTNNTPVF